LVTPAQPELVVAEHDVIVSVGGGAVGKDLLCAAIDASKTGPLAQLRWLLLSGPNMAGEAFHALAAQCPAHVEIRHFVSDLPSRLAGARLSISQAGYNTVSDVLVARCRAVLVPFEAGGETEQLTRARLMTAHGLAIMLREGEVSGPSLTEAALAALALPEPEAEIALDGAAMTARTLLARLHNIVG
jgi:predicted glycosyltransferase